MNISEVRKILNEYKGGNWRRYFSPEERIEALKKFCEVIEEREQKKQEEEKRESEADDAGKLSENDLLVLVNIILSKPKFLGSESDKTLGVIANVLGGLEALLLLKKNNLLFPENLEILEKFIQQARKDKKEQPEQIVIGNIIAELIIILAAQDQNADNLDAPPISVADLLPSEAIKNERNLKCALPYIKKLISQNVIHKSAFILLINSFDQAEIYNILLILNKQGLRHAEMFNKLEKIKNLFHFRTILSQFEENDNLVTQRNIEMLFDCDEYMINLDQIIRSLNSAKALDQTNINTLFSHINSIKFGHWVSSIITIFTKENWDLTKNFQAILECPNNEMEGIKNAINELKDLKLMPEQTQLVLHRILTMPKRANEIVCGIKTLLPDTQKFIKRESQIDPYDLDQVLENPSHGERLAFALLEAKRLGYDRATKAFILENKHVAHDLALAINELIIGEHNTPETRALLLTEQGLHYAALILSDLRKSNLFVKSCPQSLANLQFLYENKITNNSFAHLIATLSTNQLLTQANFDKIGANIAFLKEITQGVEELSKGKKLDQTTLNLLLDSPEHAVETAKEFFTKKDSEDEIDMPLVTATPEQNRNAWFTRKPNLNEPDTFNKILNSYVK